MSVSTLVSNSISLTNTDYISLKISNPVRMISVTGFFIGLMILLSLGCESRDGSSSLLLTNQNEGTYVDVTALSPFADSTETTIHVVIEIPAGSNDKIEINKQTYVFEMDRKVFYLPYPANYGFVPGTLSDPAKGGDGDPLDLMFLSTRVETGSVLEGYPIATLKLVDRGEEDAKLLVVPKDSSLRILSCITWECILAEYPLVPKLLEDWFLSYKGTGITLSEGWADSTETRRIIERHVP